jgi:hypothetical protein
VLVAVAVVGPVLWATVYRSARPDQMARGEHGAKDLLLAAVTGRWLSWGGTDRDSRGDRPARTPAERADR